MSEEVALKSNIWDGDLLPGLHEVKWLEEECGTGAAKEEILYHSPSFTVKLTKTNYQRVSFVSKIFHSQFLSDIF